jgi:hypothetical protein
MRKINKDIITNHNYNNENNLKNKHISYNDKRNTIMIVMIIVLEATTAPQLNNILQLIQRCELAIGVGQRAAY